MRLTAGVTFLFIGLAASALASSQRQVDVVVDMTDEGRKVAHPTTEHPNYYYPVVLGYKEMGATVAGEVPPKPLDVVHLAAVELAKDGYFVINKKHGQPDIFLVLFWGYLNPQIDDFGTDPTDPTSKVFFNQNQMLALVGGNTLRNLDLDFEREDVMQAAEEDRYFVSLIAFDGPSYFSHHKKVKLWQAKMSVASAGVDFPQVLTALVKAGGPFLGRETTRPKMLMAPVLPDGHVEVGTPTVKDYLDAPIPPPPSQPGNGAGTAPSSASADQSPASR